MEAKHTNHVGGGQQTIIYIIISIIILFIISFLIYWFVYRNANDNYDFYPFLASKHNTIGHYPELSLNELKTKCNELPNCLGFTTNGWLLHKIRPKSEWTEFTDDPNQGMYVKQDVVLT